MTGLLTESRFADPDGAYRALIEAHRGLSDEESAALNTRLVLLLANHIGDPEVLAQALRLARPRPSDEARPVADGKAF
ncbi:MAG TPA: DUF2783 domain-containing protein [Microvirga sp.]|jgi:predicted metal-dependent hydrolase|nr:DUF2783 domain-containing protein [Microvirga sp.]